MSIFTPSIYSEPSFTGLFRLLDDFDSYRAGAAASPNTSSQQQQQQQQQLTGTNNNVGTMQRNLLGGSRWPAAFNPKFDLRETDAAFELHGDLPGVEKDQVHIEFADEHTLTVRGRVEREWKSSSSSAGGDDTAAAEATAKPTSETGTGKAEANGAEAASNKDDNKDKEKQVAGEQQSKPAPRYWITERSVGEFSRSFRLGGHHGADGPIEIDHDGVTAKLEHGVLSVTVPKKVKKEAKERRRIAIN